MITNWFGAKPAFTGKPLQLVEAAFREDLSAMEALIAAGADVNASDGDRTCLHWSVIKPQAALLLLRHGANARAITANVKLTPLHHAVFTDSRELICALHDAGADIDARDGFGRTPLHMAADSTTALQTSVETLLKLGADAYAKTGGGRTPLDLAVENKNTAIVALLRDAGGR